MIKTLILSAIATVCLAACNQVASLAGEPTIAFAPGYQILNNTDASAIPIQGFDECPKSNPAMVKIFGDSTTEGKHTCIVVAPDTKQVSVLVALPAGSVTEQWSIIRDEGKLADGHLFSRFSMKRPDGSLVVSAKPD